MLKSFSYLLTAILLLTNLLLLSCQKEKPVNQPNPNPGTNTNALLANPQQGKPITTGTINNFTFVSKDTNVVLIIGNNASGKLYAIDIKDNDATQATQNAITNIPSFKAKIAQFMGITNLNQIAIMDMEVNPISKAVYVLVKNNTSNAAGLFKVIGGTTIVPVNLSNVSYAAITFSTNNKLIQDMTWGENELYVSMGGNWANLLDGEVGKISIPFTHNSSLTKKNTTVFTHGRYNTKAPLEKMVYGKVKNEGRLMGVTTCAPGYSFKTSALNTTGALDVKEYFDLMGGQPQKVISVTQGTSTYLVELHSEPPFLVRIGEKFIDETQPSNDRSTSLFDPTTFPKVRTTGLTDNDIKIYTDVCYVMAKYSENKVLVVDNTDQLKLITL